MNPIRFIDNLLSPVTMYRMMLYFLVFLLAVAFVFCFLGILPYDPWQLLQTTAILVVASWVINKFFAFIFRVPTNVESDYITALILALIITPGSSIVFLLTVTAIAQGSKYILAYRGKHIYNPAAIAVLITFYTIGEGASWWIGGAYILPVVLVGGLLITRKIQGFDMVISFLVVSLATFSFNTQADILTVWHKLLVETSLLFFTFVMLVEPLTSPPTRYFRIVYGAIVGVLYGSNFMAGQVLSSPELALVLGNVFSFLVSDKGRYRLLLKSKSLIANGIYNFAFEPNQQLEFKPGQYMEWTVDPNGADNRGNRRYFTIASSPTEKDVYLGVKFYDPSSSFKKKIQLLSPGDKILAGQIAGDFTLSQDPNKKLVFIAGGIGITPFRSMIKYILDKKEKRNVTIFYSAKAENEFAYKELLDEAKQFGFKVILQTGQITKEMIQKEVAGINDSVFYISGPRGMVTGFEDTLKSLGVPRRRIKIDFFPGYV